MSLSSKNTRNIKIHYQIRFLKKKKKKESIGTLASWDFKPQVDRQLVKMGKVLYIKPHVDNLNSNQTTYG